MKDLLKKLAKWVLARLSEKTTWGIIITGLTTVLGVQLSPENSEAITTAGMAVASAIGAFSTEKPKKPDSV